MSEIFVRKLRGLWRSRTHWAALLLGVLVSAQPQIESYLKIKLTPEDYAFAGMVIYIVISALRWVTTDSLEDKGK